MKKRVLAIFLAVVMCLAMASPAFAEEVDGGRCGSSVTWSLDSNGTLTISGTGDMLDYDGYVTRTPWRYRSTKVTAVVITDGVTSIGSSAFAGCDDLTSVTIPNSVTSIGKEAFYYCSNLSGVTIPNSVTDIGNSAFRGCKSLTSVTIPNSVITIEYAAFSLCDKLTSVTIPSSVTSIGDSAFAYCAALTAIQVDAGSQNYASVDGVLYTASKDVLLQCPAGKQGTADIPSGVTKIADTSFAGCESLASVTIPASVTNVGDRAFDECTGLKDVYYGGTEDQWKTIDIYVDSLAPDGNACLKKANLHYNGSGPVQPTLPTVDPIAAFGTAKSTTQTVQVNGKAVEFQTYALVDANGGVTNYIKLRDLAQILNGTDKQFEVDWDNTAKKVIINSNKAYTPNGSEGSTPFSGDRTYQADTNPVLFNGKDVAMTAFRLLDDARNGYTYYKVRDLGVLLDFYVGWDAVNGVSIDTSRPYDHNS